MSYHAFPVETYHTELGCAVVSQYQRTSAGILIENVALIGPRELSSEVDSDRGARILEYVMGHGQAPAEPDRAD